MHLFDINGIDVLVRSPAPESLFAERLITEEAALTARMSDDLRVEPLVAEGALVAQGAPVLRLRHAPELVLVAPMPARVAALELGPGHRLSSLKLFLEAGAGRHGHDVAAAGSDLAALRAALLGSGMWRLLRARPFGGVPEPGAVPAAIVVTAQDTRPLAVDPRDAVKDRMDAFMEGLRALLRLTEGPVFLCQGPGAPLVAELPSACRLVQSRDVHPWGLAGVQVHRHCRPRPSAGLGHRRRGRGGDR